MAATVPRVAYGFEFQVENELVVNYYGGTNGRWRPRDNAIDFCEHGAHDAVSGRVGRMRHWTERLA